MPADLLAIDPGLHGGLAWLEGDNVTLLPMPETDLALIVLLRHLSPAHTAIEHVSGFIGEPHPGSAMFTFGWQAGFLNGTIRTLGYPFQFVMPQVWQRALDCGGRKDWVGRAMWKRHLLHKAREFYPELKGITLKTCDALLILHALRLKLI